MQYLDTGPGNSLPWIESFGNEFEIIARLGMLAPQPQTEAACDRTDSASTSFSTASKPASRANRPTS
jgi:hypothetical protein